MGTASATWRSRGLQQPWPSARARKEVWATSEARPGRAMVKVDGSEVRTLTTGPGNSGFPSWSPDGKHVVYRFWNDAAGASPANGPTPGRAAGLRILSMSDSAVRTLTTGYDNFPCWSAKD